MASPTNPIAPMSETGYLLRQDTGYDMAEPDRPLSAQLMRHEIASNLGHIWDSGAQHKANCCENATACETWVAADVASKSGNDAYTWLRTIEFPVRLLANGFPEPIRVMLAGARSSSNIWIRAVYRWASLEMLPPWPMGGIYQDGWNVGQALFTSATPAWAEVDSVVAANDMFGILQMTPAMARETSIESYERDNGSVADLDYEPSMVHMAAVDLWGGFSSGTAGTGALWGYHIRGCAYGLLESDS